MSSLDEYADLELIGAYDTNPQRLSGFCNHYKTKAYPSLNELLDDCELLVNLTIPESHYEVSKAALLRGTPVYSEKPLTLSESDARSLVDIAVENNTNIFGAPCVHLSKMAETVKFHLDNNKIGKVYAVYAEMDNDQVHAKAYENWRNTFGVRWPAKNEFESGATLEHAAYTLCLLRKWFGEGELKSVFQHECITDKVIPLHKHTADFSCAMVEYPKGIVARITCSIVAPKNHEIVIIGEKGIITVDDIWFFDTPVRWQNFFTIRSKTRLNPIKRSLKSVDYNHPLGEKTDSAQMDFFRGVHDLAKQTSSDREAMESLININNIVLEMNGDSISEPQHPWLILGTGLMALRINDCLERNGYDVNGIYSEQPGRSQEVSQQLGLQNSYADLEQIPSVDTKTIGYVASKNTDHYEQVKALLNKGYDVLCEKPLTMDHALTEELYNLAAEKGLRLQENLWSLFLPAGEKIRDQCQEEEHIELVFCADIAYSPEKRQWEPEQGGCLYDLGIYPLAWAVYCFGDIDAFDVEYAKRDHGVISELSLSTKHSGGKTTRIKAGFYEDDHYIKAGEIFFTPIYAPEYKSTLSHHKLRKIRQKFSPPTYPAKDTYAYVLDSMNSTPIESIENPHPAQSSIHVAKMMHAIMKDCWAISEEIT
jgi:predicted dehydrogenase